MAKLTKRADGRYQINVYLGTDENGKKQYKTVYGKTQKEVNQKAADLKARLGRGIDVTAERDTFEAWADRWLIIKKSEVSAAQYKLCESRKKMLSWMLGTLRLSDITTADLQSAINELAENNPQTGKPSAKKTLEGYKQIIQQIFRTAIQARAVDYNPSEFIKIPQNAPKTARRALEPYERAWIEETPHRAQTAAMIMLYAGLRRGEVLALTWKDIDLKSGTITVNKSLSFKGEERQSIKAPKTEAGRRVIPIPKKLIDYLSGLERSSLLVVTTASGKQMTDIAWKRLWESYLSVLNEKYGNPKGSSRFDPKGLPIMITPFTPHCLRHTYCTMLYEAGVDPLVAKELMGHSDIKTTLGIYTHLSQERTVKSISLLDDYLTVDASDDECQA